MKSDKKILVAFLLNLFFSIFEFVGGILTSSVAILSDSIHDIGDAAGIGLSYFLEKKSKREPDDKYTYGYLRYSAIGGLVTTSILLVGSAVVIYNAVTRLINPIEINYNGMIIFAVVGVLVNFLAAFFTRDGESLNQKAVNLHMLEDILGWIVVLIGAIIMRLTDISIIDPIMSIGVALFIIWNAINNMKELLDVLLEKTPEGICPHELTEHVMEIDGVIGVHHIHIWSMDGIRNYATMHIVVNGDGAAVKKAVRAELAEHGISHATLELEAEGEECAEHNCVVDTASSSHTGHGHHHHHVHHHHSHHHHGHHHH